MDAPLAAADLLARFESGSAHRFYSAFGAQPFVLVDCAAADLDEAGRSRLAAWLADQPCPVLGIGSGALAPACDVLLPEADAATRLIHNIRLSPQAAAVLVQLLRLTAALPLPAALQAESLAYGLLQSGAEFRRWRESGAQPAPTAITETGPAVELQREGGRLMLTLNRASNRNAMSVEMRDALIEALQLVLADPSVEQVELSGRGRCFSTGGDLSEFGTLPDPASAHLVRALALPGRLLAQCADRVQVRVHGACVGSGIEFPAFAGRIVAAPDAYFQLPELRFGLIPGAGGCVSIARRIGRQRTAWLALSGKRIDARAALDWGLVDAIEPPM
jgi:enoyl-CoA hydratase